MTEFTRRPLTYSSQSSIYHTGFYAYSIHMHTHPELRPGSRFFIPTNLSLSLSSSPPSGRVLMRRLCSTRASVDRTRSEKHRKLFAVLPGRPLARPVIIGTVSDAPAVSQRLHPRLLPLHPLPLQVCAHQVRQPMPIREVRKFTRQIRSSLPRH